MGTSRTLDEWQGILGKDNLMDIGGLVYDQITEDRKIALNGSKYDLGIEDRGEYLLIFLKSIDGETHDGSYLLKFDKRTARMQTCSSVDGVWNIERDVRDAIVVHDSKF